MSFIVARRIDLGRADQLERNSGPPALQSVVPSNDTVPA